MTTSSWIDQWLSSGRFSKYLRAAGGDEERAVALYDWNVRLAAAFFHDLAHLEVGLRNAYDRALRIHPDLAGRDWLTEDGAELIFKPHVVRENGRKRDKNWTPRLRIKEARERSGLSSGAPRGKTIAELMFGFWSYLTDDLHEKTLWVPVLHRVYQPGADRASINAAMADLRELRNRAAHHESLFDRAPESQRRRIVYVAGQLSPELKQFIAQTSELPALIEGKP
ncbi:Abi family protein [Microlunatus speluncae]|uniref:Abi family protein n=1 Tax=Microlunatus speluncae TaxID=2594267 RepID=UPI001375DA2D|nr:Abi family protein [Microlunatus speluncae]